MDPKALCTALVKISYGRHEVTTRCGQYVHDVKHVKHRISTDFEADEINPTTGKTTGRKIKARVIYVWPV